MPKTSRPAAPTAARMTPATARGTAEKSTGSEEPGIPEGLADAALVARSGLKQENEKRAERSEEQPQSSGRAELQPSGGERFAAASQECSSVSTDERFAAASQEDMHLSECSSVSMRELAPPAAATLERNLSEVVQQCTAEWREDLSCEFGDVCLAVKRRRAQEARGYEWMKNRGWGILGHHCGSDTDDDCPGNPLGKAPPDGWETIPLDFAEQLARASLEEIERKYWAAATAPRLRMLGLWMQKKIELPEARQYDALGRHSVLKGQHQRRSELVRQKKREDYYQSGSDGYCCGCVLCAEQRIDAAWIRAARNLRAEVRRGPPGRPGRMRRHV